MDVKSKKLKKLWAKYQAAKTEQQDLQDEFRIEREDLLDTLRELSRDLSLKNAIIDNFIPKEDRGKIEEQAYYDEEAEEWIQKRKSKEKSASPHWAKKRSRPVSLPSLHRPLSQYAKIMMQTQNTSIRYRCENILSLPLDMPERTTMDLDVFVQQNAMGEPNHEDNIQGALDYALNANNEGEDIIEVESKKKRERRKVR